MTTQQANTAPSKPAARQVPSRQARAAAEAARQRDIAARLAGGRRPDIAHVAVLGYN